VHSIIVIITTTIIIIVISRVGTLQVTVGTRREAERWW
jgi:hypothetical protein